MININQESEHNVSLDESKSQIKQDELAAQEKN